MRKKKKKGLIFCGDYTDDMESIKEETLAKQKIRKGICFSTV